MGTLIILWDAAVFGLLWLVKMINHRQERSTESFAKLPQSFAVSHPVRTEQPNVNHQYQHWHDAIIQSTLSKIKNMKISSCLWSFWSRSFVSISLSLQCCTITTFIYPHKPMLSEANPVKRHLRKPDMERMWCGHKTITVTTTMPLRW